MSALIYHLISDTFPNLSPSLKFYPIPAIDDCVYVTLHNCEANSNFWQLKSGEAEASQAFPNPTAMRGTGNIITIASCAPSCHNYVDF